MKLLVGREVRLLVVANFLIAVGDSLLAIVLAVWTKDLTGSNSFAGGIYVALLIPSLAGPAAGPMIDTFPARRILVCANAITIAALAPMMLGSQTPGVWLLFAVALVYGALAVIYQGCRTVIVVQVVPPNQVSRVNSVLRTSRVMLSLVGPVIGVAIYSSFGGPIVATVAAITLGGSIVCLMYMPTRKASQHPDGVLDRRFSAGARYIVASRGLRLFLGGIVLALSVVGLFSVVELPVLDHLGLSATYLGPLTGLEGLGALGGGVLAPRLCDSVGEVRLVAIGCVLQATAGLLLVTGSLVPLLVAVILYGAGLPMTLIGMDTMFMNRTPIHLQGRVSTAVEALTGIPLVFSFAVASGAVAFINFRLIALVMAVGTLLALPLMMKARLHDGESPSASPFSEGATSIESS